MAVAKMIHRRGNVVGSGVYYEPKGSGFDLQ
jgi:hypothetical protein